MRVITELDRVRVEGETMTVMLLPMLVRRRMTMVDNEERKQGGRISKREDRKSLAKDLLRVDGTYNVNE